MQPEVSIPSWEGSREQGDLDGGDSTYHSRCSPERNTFIINPPFPSSPIHQLHLMATKQNRNPLLVSDGQKYLGASWRRLPTWL